MNKLEELLKEHHFDKNNIKAVAIDIDGTLINEDGVCTERTVEAIQKLKQSGREVFLITGRGVNTAMPFAKQCKIENYMINYNGAAIWNMQTSTRDYEKTIDLETAQGIIGLTRKHQIFTIVYSNDEYYYELINDICHSYINRVSYEGFYQNFDTLDSFQKIMINAPQEQIDKFYQELIDLYGHNIHHIITTPGIHKSAQGEDYYPCVEIMAKNVDKGVTLALHLENLGIEKDQVVAFGDDTNDIGMLSSIKWGIAMGNARESVKECSPFMTKTNNDEGVAYFIETFIL